MTAIAKEVAETSLKDPPRAIIAAHKPGDAVPVTFRSRGTQRGVHVSMPADSRLEVVTYEEAGRPVTEAVQKFRVSWLGPQN